MYDDFEPSGYAWRLYHSPAGCHAGIHRPRQAGSHPVLAARAVARTRDREQQRSLVASGGVAVNAAEAIVEVHPFERAGLGKAPFRVIGCQERVHVIPGIISANVVKPGGCCKYCYTGIRYAAVIKSSDGNVFDVGLDCVRKVDFAAYKEAREFRRADLREVRGAASREAATAARVERERLEAAREAAFREAHADLAAIIDALLPVDGFPGACAGNALSRVRANGSVSRDRDEVFVTEWKLRELHAERTAVGHLGIPGKRTSFQARYVGRFVYDTQYGRSSVYKFTVAREDGTHSMLVWRTSSVMTVDDGVRGAELGTMLEVKATVTEHGEFHGLPQTMISRPKFTTIGVGDV